MPGTCVHTHTHIHTHSRAENNQVVEEEWAAAAGEEAKTTLRERNREGRSDCTSPCESRSEGKSIVLKHLVEVSGFPYFITNLLGWGAVSVDKVRPSYFSIDLLICTLHGWAHSVFCKIQSCSILFFHDLFVVLKA